MEERKYTRNWSDFNMVLQCTHEEFYNRIESLFKPGMSWNNYGTDSNQWTIENIIPLDHFYHHYNPLILHNIRQREEHDIITIEDMCICVNVHPVWNCDKKILPSKKEVFKKCFEIIRYKNELSKNDMSRSSSSSSLHKRNSLDQ